ncbi:hypothetical protein AC578_9415 [Pseudocercospora eumusae]|uniref:Uncharacterized protein n=1 Tax=Pseudocercospora eumusae TaxID=321146 RepID=A0A139H6V2_9PEZI|nr:hypothetical protein AC578_9415 [Pseudocercospora eumusae]
MSELRTQSTRKAVDSAIVSTHLSAPLRTRLLTPASDDEEITDEMLAENERILAEEEASLLQTDPFGDRFSDRSEDEELEEYENTMKWTLISDHAGSAEIGETVETAEASDGIAQAENGEEVTPDRPNFYKDELARRTSAKCTD